MWNHCSLLSSQTSLALSRSFFPVPKASNWQFYLYRPYSQLLACHELPPKVFHASEEWLCARRPKSASIMSPIPNLHHAGWESGLQLGKTNARGRLTLFHRTECIASSGVICGGLRSVVEICLSITGRKQTNKSCLTVRVQCMPVIEASFTVGSLFAAGTLQGFSRSARPASVPNETRH
jgi:hypothetical protein